MAIAQQRLTLEQFIELPEAKPALEYIDGVVTQKVPPMFHHSVLQGKTLALFNSFCVPRRLAYALGEIRWTSEHASVVPDVGVYLWDRIPLDAHGEVVNDQRVLPDIAVEIRSPDQSRKSQIERCRWYIANGVQIALLVDSVARDRRVDAFRPNTPELTLRGGDVIDLGDVLPGFQLRVHELFDALMFR